MVAAQENVVEFLAYRIIYCALTCQDADVVEEIPATPAWLRTSGPVAHALRVTMSLNPLNPWALRELARDAPNMGRRLITLFLHPPRGLRMQIYPLLLKAYRPILIPDYIREALLFGLGSRDPQKATEWKTVPAKPSIDLKAADAATARACDCTLPLTDDERSESAPRITDAPGDEKRSESPPRIAPTADGSGGATRSESPPRIDAAVPGGKGRSESPPRITPATDGSQAAACTEGSAKMDVDAPATAGSPAGAAAAPAEAPSEPAAPGSPGAAPAASAPAPADVAPAAAAGATDTAPSAAVPADAAAPGTPASAPAAARAAEGAVVKVCGGRVRIRILRKAPPPVRLPKRGGGLLLLSDASPGRLWVDCLVALDIADDLGFDVAAAAWFVHNQEQQTKWREEHERQRREQERELERRMERMDAETEVDDDEDAMDMDDDDDDDEEEAWEEFRKYSRMVDTDKGVDTGKSLAAFNEVKRFLDTRRDFHEPSGRVELPDAPL